MLLAFDNATSSVVVLSRSAGRVLVERYTTYGCEWEDHTFKDNVAAINHINACYGRLLFFWETEEPPPPSWPSAASILG